MHHYLFCALALLVLTALPQAARSQNDGPLRASASAAGVQIRWEPAAGATEEQLVALRVEGHAPLTPHILRLSSHPSPAPAEAPPEELPEQPVRVLREAYANGVRLAVVAVSPRFRSGAGPHTLTQVEALIPGAALFDGNSAALFARPAGPVGPPPAPPTNPSVATAVARIRVAAPGIQRVSGAALAAAGLDIAALDPAGLRVFHGGSEIALELTGAGDGRIDTGDELRFFAAPPGDRWNATDTYWIVPGQAAGLRMQSRSAIPSGASACGSALERGRWRSGQIFETTQGGPLGDHWFAAELAIDPSSAATSVATTLPLTPSLPLAAGSLTLTVEGAARTAAVRTLSASAGSASQSLSQSGTGAWSATFTLAANPAAVELSLQRGVAPHLLLVQSASFVRPVTLAMGGRGALFEGQSQLCSYAVSGSAAGRTLYDVTDPQLPVRLSIPDGADFSFQDGPSRAYALTGPGALFEPTVTGYAPTDLAAPLNADVLYITPAELQAQLAPLLDQRRSQGYQPQTVDVQAIYDAWSDGQVDPRAIRSFLRYARATWATPPVAVVLVGDGTADPLDYIGRHNVNYIPPYLADVDPWLVETACETCYAQLDGESPLDDLLPDLALGRLPVKSPAELAALVAKIVGYERGPVAPDWQSRAVFVADNYREATGQPDGAGDFAGMADLMAGALPPGIQSHKLYYDPSPNRPDESWREPDAVRAHQRTIGLLNQGAALVTYLGHSSQFQWASTDLAAQPPYLLGMFDADLLSNTSQLAIVRELTCLTAAFQTPAFSGTSIDERLLLQPGGAVAVWGPTGLGVAHGHDALARGFDQALWGSPQPQPPIGQLTLAGYLELYTQGNCCQDTLRTYVILGDPLTPVRALPASRVALPSVVTR
jgi:hypothetical protein